MQIVACEPEMNKSIGDGNERSGTNVFRLSRAIKPCSSDGTKLQLVFYQSAVGSEVSLGSDTAGWATACRKFFPVS